MQHNCKVFFIAVLTWLFLFASPISVANEVTPLPVDEAFTFSAIITSFNELSAEWHIAPGYYLYTKRLHITLQPTTPANIYYPQGDLKYDLNRVRQEVYAGYLSIPILLRGTAQPVQMEVAYQGCSEDGFCYPPMHKSVKLNWATHTVTPIEQTNVSLSALLTDQHGINDLLQSQHFSFILVMFIGLGLLLALTPCVLPMIPIMTSIIVGQKQPISTQKAFSLSAVYVLGMAIAYALVGFAAAAMGSSLQVWMQQPAVIIIMSGLFILLACSLFGFYTLRIPRFIQQGFLTLNHHQQGGTYLSVFLMGLFSTFIVCPCVTAPLIGVLMYISQTGNRMLGASALFAMGIGMGLPLLCVGVSARKWLPKSGPWMKAVEKSVGVMMLAMAIWLLSRIASPLMIKFLWSALLIGIAFFIAWYLPRVIGKRALNRGLGVLVGCSGMLLLMSGINPTDLSPVISKPAFILVHDVASLNQQLSLARAEHKPVLLDFYADWCESCVTMDKHVFHAASVKQALTPYILLRADLSDNTVADEVLMKQYEVIAPPTVLFFDANGHEVNTSRIVGEVSTTEFLDRLRVVNS